MTVWKPITGFPDYEISDEGQIKSIGRVNCYGRTVKECILRLHTRTRDGYLTANILNNGRQKTVKVHRIVADEFIPNPNSLVQVNHKDGDKTKNAVDNLEWVSPAQNMIHKHNVLKKNNNGELNGQSRLTANDINAIIADARIYKDIAQEYGIGEKYVGKIKNRRCWKHLMS